MASIENMKTRIRKALSVDKNEDINTREMPESILIRAMFRFIEEDDITKPEPAGVALWRRVAEAVDEEVAARDAEEAQDADDEKKGEPAKKGGK